VSWIDSEGVERGGACNTCGEQVEAEHHALCRRCYAAEQGWDDDEERTAPGSLSAWRDGFEAGYRAGVRDARTGRAA
jgi:hypothetical protein